MRCSYFSRIDPAPIAAWVSEVSQAHPGAVFFVLVPEDDSSRVPNIQRLFADLAVPMVGGIFPALVSGSAFVRQGVVVLALFHVLGSFLIDALDADASAAADTLTKAASQCLTGNDRPVIPQLFMVFDSMIGNTSSILIRLFDRLGRRLSYSGVNAGSETFQPVPCLFDTQRLVSRGVIGLVLQPETQIAVEHGYPVSAKLLRATSTLGNRIDTIDGRPAMTVYREIMAAEYGVALTPENFYEYAVHYPFGLVGTLDVFVRIPVAFNDDGSLFCIGEIPPNALLRILKAPAYGSSCCISALASGLSAGEAGASEPLVTFYCAGRRLHYGDDATRELAALSHEARAEVMVGALSLGEIGTEAELGIPSFHNAALVCLR